MKTLQNLQIPQPNIALFGSGTSVNTLTKSEFNFIKSQCFVITINYAPVKLQGHLNMWSDRRVSTFLNTFYESNPKECLLLAQKNKVPSNLEKKVDFWFHRTEDKLKGNFTIVWALQLLQNYFPQKNIFLFGVDMYHTTVKIEKWYDQWIDYDKKKRGRRYNIQHKLDQCAKQIERYCKKDKVFNCNPKSQLLFFEKRDWRNLLDLKILHLCATPLAGAPYHLSNIINKYTGCTSISVLKSDFKSIRLQNLKWDYDIKSPSVAKLKSLTEWADLIHFHRKIYPCETHNKKTILQYHSPPNGYKAGKTHAQFNGRKLVIAQYHPRFYTDALIVPNLIDIWDDQYLPGSKTSDKVKIFYSWATEIKGGWSDKGSRSTKKILKRIKAKYGKRVEIKILHNRPYKECLAEKKTAHICIDECVTGSYHLQSLEGCAVGALTFNNIDQKTQTYLAKVTKQNSHPFVKSNLSELFEKLCFYIENPAQLQKIGQAARIWMENHWDPKKLVYQYLTAYADIIQYNEIRTENTTPKQKINSSFSNEQLLVKTQPVKPNTETNRTTIKSSSNPLSISSLYKQFEGQDIYIFGTGPSLLQIAPEQYKDQICFGVNYAFEHMPYLNYHFVHVIETYEAIRKHVDNRKLVLPETLVRQWYRERHKNIRPQRIQTKNDQAYIYPIQSPTERNLHQKHTLLRKDTHFFTWSTTTHSAIHIAAYMGATNIFLIGMDYELFPNGKVHFESRYSPIYGRQNWNTNQKHRQGDEWLARQLAKQGVQVKNISHEISSRFHDQHQGNYQPML